VTDNDYAIAYGECFEWSADGMQILPIPSNLLFDSRGGFLGSSYPMKTAEIRV